MTQAIATPVNTRLATIRAGLVGHGPQRQAARVQDGAAGEHPAQPDPRRDPAGDHHRRDLHPGRQPGRRGHLGRPGAELEEPQREEREPRDDPDVEERHAEQHEGELRGESERDAG